MTRCVGYAVLTVDKSETVDEVVFAQTGDLQLLGPRALWKARICKWMRAGKN